VRADISRVEGKIGGIEAWRDGQKDLAAQAKEYARERVEANTKRIDTIEGAVKAHEDLLNQLTGGLRTGKLMLGALVAVVGIVLPLVELYLHAGHH
jgi:hypothetical protein